ncbi:N-acetylglucosaminyl-phosphatidylinositol de-N-acetylase [Elasticomyces elasticus]|uniref:N-acetylglucosaminylphosphatidylinositol deacetylase n=1 Tax=Exophiala sideris TaxID=1016849 RepID=A0ABR0J8A7_9EURO|nr:N-acetylglucosaminyl-phosphatidylinositol de-N-acetylase [Elasticomyces elasticus]KAK5029907.1 hypothetical protein LTS07_005631 [Exophiala sideris]KAK5031653.1 N-acetylglucosaminyl-phosphatidylinositol de-N-acetylase [Exophiala sideris]KAK5058331.1 hypothetical protein LTR69_006736 [Exophiala sideris]KAK5180260.1 hypothetical protein LTR44_007386 [Eurotiomycetes sp. CCFEE 6388]
MPRRNWRKKYPFLYTRRAYLVRTIFTYIITYFALLPTLLWLVLASQSNPFPEQLYDAQRVLIVLAHRGDESLFFGPTILRLTGRPEQDKLTRLLVLSKGNITQASYPVKTITYVILIADHDGKGETDNTGLTEACAILGIADRHCDVRDLPGHQDDSGVVWSQARIEATVKDYAMKWAADAIISFDNGGVSGDKSHISVSDAIVNYVSRTESAPPVYTLTTTSVLGKYSLFGDLPLTALTHVLRRLFFNRTSAYAANDASALFVNSFAMWRRSVAALQQHESQDSWHRYLYVMLSRYMWFNDLKLVVPGSAKQGQSP